MKYVVCYTEELRRCMIVDADGYEDANQKVLDAVDNECHIAEVYELDVDHTLESLMD